DPVVRPRVAARGAGNVEQVDEQARALDVAKELVAQPRPLVRAFDEPGDVGDDEAPAGVYRNHAKVGDQGGERVVGDLRLRGRDPGNQSGLADVRETDQAHVGEELQVE